jgi:RNA polymerase sigma-70 factor (ECF subfamily)
VLAELYAQHAKALHGFVMNLVARDHQLAEDIVQETMLRAWRNAEKLDPTRPSLRPWLFTVARRIVIDSHRMREARPREIDPNSMEHLPEADQIERSLWSIAVADALRSLSPAHREIIEEVYLRDRKPAETAELLGLPLGTVKSRTYYALQALRLAMAERGLMTLD